MRMEKKKIQSNSFIVKKYNIDIFEVIGNFLLETFGFKYLSRKPRWYDFIVSPITRWLILIVVIIYLVDLIQYLVFGS